MVASGDDIDDFPTFSVGGRVSPSDGYLIPVAPAAVQHTRWLGYSESINIAGFHIRKGFIYVGPTLVAPSGRQDPSLIDPIKNVASTAAFATGQTYSISYSEASPSVRRAYLQWLADGRSAPDADIGLVFLYFYGLERRIILDILQDGIGASDFPDIYKELKRLYAQYAPMSPSFRRHCAQLIELVEVAASEEKLYERELVAFPATWGFPFLIRLALGQAVRDRVPIPAHIALTWAEHDPAIIRRTSVVRCSAEFKQIFLKIYSATHGDGLKLTPNRTKLKLIYDPASPGFYGSGGVNMHFGETPDISALTGPVKLLQEVVEACATQLDAFSRYLGRNSHGRAKFEGLLYLPVVLWPHAARAQIDVLKTSVRDGFKPMTFGELLARFGVQDELGREQQLVFFGALESEGLCVESELTGKIRALRLADRVVMFDGPLGAADVTAGAAYKVARLSVELAAAVAHADGNFCERELDHLYVSIRGWEHLAVPVRMRLEAYACLLQESPAALSSMKKKIDVLDSDMRASVAAFAASMVLADDVASTEEVKLVEKIYQQLGIERGEAYSAIYSGPSLTAPSGKAASAAPPSGASQFTLDTAKIAALKIASQQIAARLAGIFEEEPEPIVVPVPVPQEPVASTVLLGLDHVHSAFARILSSRSQWQRSELIDVADDLAIMLDGALERLNEASLDEHDIIFAEDGDPIEINPEIMEKLA